MAALQLGNIFSNRQEDSDGRGRGIWRASCLFHFCQKGKSFLRNPGRFLVISDHQNLYDNSGFQKSEYLDFSASVTEGKEEKLINQQ